MRVKIKLSKATFYDFETRQMFSKTFAGNLTHKQALERLAPANKTRTITVDKFSQVFEIDDLLLYDFLMSHGALRGDTNE